MKPRQPRPNKPVLRGTIADRARDFLAEWSLPRQMRGESPFTDVAKSRMTETLRPRLEEADTVGTNICPYCAVGCAQLIYAKEGRVIHGEGDPRSPINQGTKKTRDETFVEKLPDGTAVNHTLGIASLGGATLDNEENYLIKKLFSGGLGMVWVENQARV
ncbi:hypothetical protein [Azospirillum sp. B2RO_4]|uniref:hypothetical protein n=1 Tax=Azospirillum sp. B2RO_4 TaxID=3027796 RepID=UPI003DA99204